MSSQLSIRTRRRPPFSRFPQSLIESVFVDLDLGMTREEVCFKYGMSGGALRGWIARKNNPIIKKAIVQFDNDRRREVARAIIEGRMTVKEAQHLYSIPAAETIRHWVRKLKKEDRGITKTKAAAMPSITPVDDQRMDELAEAKLRISALETMIDIAEKQFKINIRKKSGAKQ